MPYISEALASLRDDDPSMRALGARFEKAVRDALRAHPGEYGKERFTDVWLWKDWPEREKHGFGLKDTGIDLVARQTELWGGGFCAIQCKYGESTVGTSEIDSFLATSGTKAFNARLLVTSRTIAGVGMKEINLAYPECRVLHTSDMDDWVEDWRKVIKGTASVGKIKFDKHEPRPYQRDALRDIGKGFVESSKGKLILPCGTGKSFVALRAAEQEAGAGGTVLYLVPSIALMGQTMREWSRHRSLPLEYLGVCSDVSAGRKTGDDSSVVGDLAELAMPVTTDSKRLAEELKRKVPTRTMRVIFSTYQSTPKIAEALEKLRSFRFDLVICDEAHRTTGISEAEMSGSKKSSGGYRGVSPFLLVHQDKYLPADKRLFMTATPRVFTARVKKNLEQSGFDGDSYSMDDEAKFGPEFYRMSFATALDGGFLSPYEVLVIVASESAYLQTLAGLDVVHEGSEASLETAVKLAGCWDALATPLSLPPDLRFGRTPGQIDLKHSGPPARSAIAFCNTVRSSQKVECLWPKVTSTITSKHEGSQAQFLTIDVNHLDGTTPANDRADLLHQLRTHADGTSGGSETTCRVLTNAQVLSEGVDVPALDSVLFLEPRKSAIDITQAVGRAMRTAPGKERGYIVIPVIVPDFGEGDVDERAQHILANGDFSPVWEVARALRSHDDRIDYWCNNITAAREKAPFELRISGETRSDEGDSETELGRAIQQRLALELDEQFASMLVDSLGNREMYPRWGQHAARVCETVRLRIDDLLARNTKASKAFEEFVKGLKKTVRSDITEDSAAQMVAQHVVTIPVFDVMFDESEFAKRNPMSKSIGRLLEVFQQENVSFEEDLYSLRRAYKTMQDAFHGAVSGAEKLEILREIYDGFFKAAMADEVKALGIAYTPVELVDFMLRFTNEVCKKHFDRSLSDKNIHILDPFTGTGTFVNRLLTVRDKDGNYLISDKDIDRKYGGEIHANEIVLLAYYIAALKIEEAKYERSMEKLGGNNPDKINYEPFRKILLTDTFLMSELGKDDRFDFDNIGLKENNERKALQNETPIRVIVTNPPWSAGVKKAGDNTQKMEHNFLSERIADTYGRRHNEITGKGGGKALGNTYVKAFRWSSDRVKLPSKNRGNSAIVTLITPNSLSDASSLAGMRACLREEFTDIYVLNLLGNNYKNGDERLREGEVLFQAIGGSGGSKSGVQVTVLVRDPKKDLTKLATLHYAEVPEYSKLDEKFDWVKSIESPSSKEFKKIPFTKKHDWVNIGDGTFTKLMPVCSDKEVPNSAINRHALGLTTNADVYLYSFSRNALINKIRKLISEFNRVLRDWENTNFDESAFEELTGNQRLDVIKWTDRLKQTLKNRKKLRFREARIREVQYRPFTRIWLYEDPDIVSSVKTISTMFPRNIATPPPRYSSAKASKSPSGSSQPTNSQTFAHSDDRAEQSPGDLAHTTKHCVSVLSNDGLEATRPTCTSTWQCSKSYPPAILITAPSNRTVFSVQATFCVPDVNCFVLPGRAIPRSRTGNS